MSEEIVWERDVEWKETGDGWVLKKFKKERAKSVAIPDAYQGKPIVEIGEWAFAQYVEIDALSIGNNVKRIRKYAFADCIVRQIAFGNSLVEIEQGAFQGCYGFRLLRFPDSLETIENCAFTGCQDLLIAELGNGLKRIGDYAFSKCPKLAEITLEGSVETVGDGAFSKCPELERLLVGENVKTLGRFLLFGSDKAKIFCRAVSRPAGWHEDWNGFDRPVVWGYDGI